MRMVAKQRWRQRLANSGHIVSDEDKHTRGDN